MSEMAERKGGSDERGQGGGEEGCEEGGRGGKRRACGRKTIIEEEKEGRR